MRTKTNWDLFFECFKVGDDVIVVFDNDKFYYAKIVLHEGEEKNISFSLCNTVTSRMKRFNWEDVTFISHDGFPVKQMIGADGSQLIEEVDTKHIQLSLRERLARTFCDIVFADPYLIENVSGKLYNPGNCGERFWGNNFEECLMLEAKDGAKGQLFDLPHIYHFS